MKVKQLIILNENGEIIVQEYFNYIRILFDFLNDDERATAG